MSIPMGPAGQGEQAALRHAVRIEFPRMCHSAWENTLQRYMHLSPAAKSVAIRMLEGTKQEAQNGDGLETKKDSSP